MTTTPSDIVELANGVQMPVVALGTAPLMTNKEDSSGFNPLNSFHGFLPEQSYQSVQALLDMKLENNKTKPIHIDTALYYGTHPHIRQVLGNAFLNKGLKRSDFFLTTKVFHMYDGFGLEKEGLSMPPDPDCEMTYTDVHKFVTKQFQQALHECGIGYFDLVLLHWPGRKHPKTSQQRNAQHRLAAWHVLEEAYCRGWARSIGVSNFSEHHLEELQQLNEAAQRSVPIVRPHVNQIEASVFVQHKGILEYCLKQNIVAMAYSPLGRGVMHVTTNEVVSKMATKYGKDAGQVALKYLLQKGYGSLVFWTKSPGRVVSNHDLFDFELNEAEVKELDGLNRKDGTGTWGLLSPYAIP